MDNVLEQFLETWRTNNRINLFLIDQISDEGMTCTLSTRGGRNVVRQFAHLHNLRVWHLENRAKDLAEGLYLFETHEEPDKKTLRGHLLASSERIEAFFERCITGNGKARCFKKGPIAYLGYFISHESHHRGSILLTLKQCGHKLDQKSSYAIWNWDGM
jgi:uncharacterized damage-inducible protein DinB